MTSTMIEPATKLYDTLAKLSKGQAVNSEIIERICAALSCQPGDIMEFLPDTGKKEELS